MHRKNWNFPENQQEILSRFFDIPYDIEPEQQPYTENTTSTYDFFDDPVLQYDDTSDDVPLTRLEERCFSNEEEFFYSLCQSFVSSGFKRQKAKLTKKKIRPKRCISAYKKKKAEHKQEVIAQNVAKKYSSSAAPSNTCSYNSTSQNSSCRTTSPPANAVFERELQNAINRPGNQTHASGLTFAQLTELCNRELTPEDYELLLSLDNTVAKKTVKTGKVESFKEKVIEEETEEVCSVCMSTFEKGEKTKVLPCSHIFHVDCIVPWLTNHSQTCPMCKVNVNTS